MWFTLLKGVGFKLLGLLKSPVVWIVILAALNVFAFKGWERARAEVVATQEACQAAAEAILKEGLEKQAEAWQSVYSAQQEAVARMAQEAGVAAATAREWRRRYEAAKQTPKCREWMETEVQCPVE